MARKREFRPKTESFRPSFTKNVKTTINKGLQNCTRVGDAPLEQHPQVTIPTPHPCYREIIPYI